MKIDARLSLVLLVACSAAGSDELFPTAVTVPPEEPPAMAPSEPEALASPGSADPPDVVDGAPQEMNGDDTPAASDTDGDVTGPTPDADDVAPSLRTTFPTDGEVGVTSNTEIVLRFSESMDPRTTRAALRSSDGPVAATEAWHDRARELRLSPARPLAYAAFDSPALTYVVDIAEGARDAAGNALPPQAFSFQTLRTVTQTLLPVASSELTGSIRGDGGATSESCAAAICVGDDVFSTGPESSAQHRGFLSFDLTELPAELVEIVGARIRLEVTSVQGDPFGVLGELRLERAAFDAVGPAAFEAAPQATFAALTDPELGATGEHILWAVNADLERDVLHQYRLNFDRGSNRDGASDLALFAPEEQRLEITYLLP